MLTDRIPLCIFLLLSIGSCRSGEQPAPAADDSVRAMVTEQQFLGRQLDMDTVTGLAVAPSQDPVSTERAGAAPEASPAELRALADALHLPVRGVTPAELVGSFDDARGLRRHEALDIRAPRGTPVVSATTGRLMKLHTSDFGGLMVYAADESERFVLLYAHLDRYAAGLSEGMPLRRGQVLGYVGTTGNAPPHVPHLHFGIARVADVDEWWRGTPVDPLPLLRDSVAGNAGRAP
jgi:peptidoglycan LD-endopeptidase LytH